MSRLAEKFYSKGDAIDTPSGDSQFQGIDMTHDKPLLQPGMLSLGQNTRVRSGRCKQRFGTQYPFDFNPVDGFANSLLGSGVFRNPNGAEVLLVTGHFAVSPNAY